MVLSKIDKTFVFSWPKRKSKSQFCLQKAKDDETLIEPQARQRR